MKSLYTLSFLLLLKFSALNAQKTITICEGDSTQLTTSIVGLDYSWQTTEGLSNPKIRNPLAKPTQTTTYISTVYSLQQNILSNSDFTQGSTGFTSDYSVSNNAGSGRYLVTNNGPKSWWVGFSACNDHTSGAGNMMLVDGASALNQNVWCQEIAVKPNTDYAFSAWLQNICTCGSPPRLQFGINGVNLGNIIDVTNTNCQWNQFYEIWNSGNNTTAKICLLNQNTNPNGNDFAIDDITFTPVTPSHDTIVVNVIPKSVTSIVNSICKGDSLFFNNQFYKKTGNYVIKLKSVKGCDSTVNLNLTVLPENIRTQKVYICSVDTYKIGDSTYKKTGIYRNILRGYQCDSIVITDLEVFIKWTEKIDTIICATQSLKVNNKIYNQTGHYRDTIPRPYRCDTIFDIHLTVMPLPFRMQNMTLCQGEMFKINNKTYNKTGIYTDSIAIKNGCDSIIVTNINVIDLSLTLGNDTIIQNGDNMRLNPLVNSQNTLSWKWSPPTGLSCADCKTPIATPLSKMLYQLTVKDTKYGCTATDDIFIKVNPCEKVFIPNSFSPNDDTFNDVFTAYGADCAKRIKKMDIFNRWGNLVFTTENATLGNDSQGWNGQFKGKKLPTGVYVYVIEIEYGNGTSGIYSGDVSLVE